MRKTLLVGFGIGLLSFFWATSIFQFFRIGGVVFNTGIIVAVCTALLCSRNCFFAAVLVYAAFVDLFASRLLGINFAIYLCMALLLSYASEEFYVKSAVLPLILLVLSTLFYHMFYFLIMSVGRALLQTEDIIRIVLIETAYNAVVGFLAYALMFRLVRGHRLGKENV